MKHAAIYSGRDLLLVHADSRTQQGVWILDGPCAAIQQDVPDDVLGATVLDALSRSRVVPHPTTWKGLFDPVLKAAHARGWRSFVFGTKHVSASLGESLTMVPFRNAGAREGFVPIDSASIVLAWPARPADVGAAVREALLRCVD